jgi:TonB family protein
MFSRLRQSLYIFIICSLFLHTLTWVGFELQSPPPIYRAKEHVEVEIVTQDARNKDRDAKEKSEKRQIVEQENALNDDKDEKSKFLSAFDQKVAKQTQAARKGEFQNAGGKGQKVQAPPKQQQQANADRVPPPKPNPNLKGLPSLSALKPQMRMAPTPPDQPGDAGDGQAESRSDDYLKDVEVGLQTMLSTREFVYYSYYNRIKERIRQHWEPNIREKVKMIFRQGRSIASTKDHVTQVVITLNKEGELIGVDIITPSGVEALDSAAVEAFRAAQPFPNPPKGLIDEDGTIKIRWDFVLEASSYQPELKTRRIARAEDLSGQQP